MLGSVTRWHWGARPAAYSWAWFRLLPADHTDTGVSPFADPPQRRHRPVRLPVLLLAALGVVAHLGRRRRPTLVHRGILPSRARPPPSATLEVLASLDHPGHAR